MGTIGAEADLGGHHAVESAQSIDCILVLLAIQVRNVADVIRSWHRTVFLGCGRVLAMVSTNFSTEAE